MKTLQEIKSTTRTEHSKRGRLTLPLFDFVRPGREVNNQEARRPPGRQRRKQEAWSASGATGTKKTNDCRGYTRRSTIIFLISATVPSGTDDKRRGGRRPTGKPRKTAIAVITRGARPSSS
ncbi:predicted protein [Brucella abortus bv. 3 str. Tulya]|nr:predicted protein [Brucella abortus bv. 3 str. Tulya]